MVVQQGTRLLLAVAMICLLGCSGKSFLKENESFYDGSEIEFDTEGRRIRRKKEIRAELQELIAPKPNGKFLGMRPGVWFYYISGDPKKKKGLGNFIRKKLGSPPVFITDVNPQRTATLLAGTLNNKGYFKSTVSSEVKTKRKESTVIYTVKLKRPYRLDTIRYPRPRDSVYAPILREVSKNSLLKTRQRYDLERMQAEQARMEKALEDKGFYYFDDRYLIFEADSTVGKRKVNLALRLEPGIPTRAKRIYKFGTVSVLPDYSIIPDSISPPADTTIVDRYRYIDRNHRFRPEILTRVINIREGETYSREAQRLTLSHLMGLGVFKFVNIKFSELHTDSSKLITHILLTTLPKKSLRAEAQGVTKSNNFVGPGLTLTFTNRNFLRGAELFQLKLNAGYEWQISRQDQGALNSLEIGLESSLTVPRFISPIRIDYNSATYLPKTIFKAGLNIQNRVGYYRLGSANLGYGYIWRETADKTHELFVADVSYVRTDKKSPEFDSLLLINPILNNSFENQFIIGTKYSFTYNSQLREDPLQKFEKRTFRPHNFYFNGNVDVAGNAIHAVQQIGSEGTDPFQIFGLPYSQYVKGDVDFRYYWQLDKHNKIASRIIVGAGYAYGNATNLPYIKQFAVGGSNSLRAFQARSVGPGTYYVRNNVPEDQPLFIDQRGDIKLEGNTEYRFDIFKILKGALFVDAGNIWTFRYEETREGGQFDGNTFLSQLAVGTGFGLRVDFSFFVFRFDTAFPIRKPWLEQGPDWVFNEIDFGNRAWRKENLIFNIAFGYPF
ncbi:MAG TPA: BamA/TamA family outer membrane protein [Chryseolinea sp.]|nr:BamA/TamA family outer membrane protein [Chryseolinea sp.]